MRFEIYSFPFRISIAAKPPHYDAAPLEEKAKEKKWKNTSNEQNCSINHVYIVAVVHFPASLFSALHCFFLSLIVSLAIKVKTIFLLFLLLILLQGLPRMNLNDNFSCCFIFVLSTFFPFFFCKRKSLQGFWIANKTTQLSVFVKGLVSSVGLFDSISNNFEK